MQVISRFVPVLSDLVVLSLVPEVTVCVQPYHWSLVAVIIIIVIIIMLHRYANDKMRPIVALPMFRGLAVCLCLCSLDITMSCA